jgi:prevent-host-death family protein
MRTTLSRTAGVRDAKTHLSRILADVQDGHEWTITERGVPIARLVSISAETSTVAQRLSNLERRGALEAAPRHPRPLPPPLTLEPGLARRLLDEERGR